MYCVRWSNEAATVHADITADHRDVPANLLTSLLEWDVANPRTTLPTSTICFFLTLSIFNQFTAFRSILIGELHSVHFRIHSAAFIPTLARCPVLFCTNDTFQVNNSKSFSKQVCVCVYVCVCVCLCVSVNHLNRCKTSLGFYLNFTTV